MVNKQDSVSVYFQFKDASPFSCLFAFFPSSLIQNGIELKSFLRGKAFLKLRQRFGDPRAVDAIYVRSMRLTNNNTALALLLASIATFDHRMVGFKVPMLKLFFPLSDESDGDFLNRVNNLPAHIYRDGPAGRTGDRDKLQHFFGSAFLTFIFESRNSAERFGMFIEKGEDAFIVDGMLDPRDIRANHQGQQFGLALLVDNHHFPSEFLRFEIAEDTASSRQPTYTQPPFGER